MGTCYVPDTSQIWFYQAATSPIVILILQMRKLGFTGCLNGMPKVSQLLTVKLHCLRWGLEGQQTRGALPGVSPMRFPEASSPGSSAQKQKGTETPTVRPGEQQATMNGQGREVLRRELVQPWWKPLRQAGLSRRHTGSETAPVTNHHVSFSCIAQPIPPARRASPLHPAHGQVSD